MFRIIPEIYHKRHNKLFNEITEKTKTEFYEKLSNKILYTPNYIEFSFILFDSIPDNSLLFDAIIYCNSSLNCLIKEVIS